MNTPLESSPAALPVQSAAQLPDEDEISLIDLATTLGEEKTFIAGFTAVVAVLAIIVSLVMTPVFTGKTVLIPPQQQQSSAAAALAGLGALAGAAGGALGVKSPDEMYLAFLQTDRIYDAIIDRFGLMQQYDVELRMEARKRLDDNSKITSDKKSGLITIEVDDPNPEQAATMANAFVEELYKLLGQVAVSEAQQRRQFLENQLSLTKERLSRAELALRDLQTRSGVFSLDAQTQGAMRGSIQLRAQIAQTEVELGILRTFATAENAEVRRLLAELSGLRSQLAKVEQGAGMAARGEGKGSPATNAADGAEKTSDPKGLETVRAYREVKYQEAIMDALVRQYELAKVDEAREGPLLQQVVVATPPERKSKPKRALIVVLATVAAGFLAVLIAFVRQALRNASRDPEGAEKMAALKRAWTWR